MNDRDKVYAQIEDLPENVRISTFGIGPTFDDHFITHAAKRGPISRIPDLDRESLPAAFITALNWAMYPVLEGCEIAWTDENPEKVGDVFQGQVLSSYRIFDESRFDSDQVEFTFYCDKNPLTNATIE